MKVCCQIFNIEKEKKKLFSYNHINELHKKVDWGIRISSSIILILLVFYSIEIQEYPAILSLIVLVIFTTIDFAVKAFFEWRYSDNPKQSILTISEMIIWITAIIIVIQIVIHYLD
ncbi:DUF4181 domain-containing protein [Lysinibacillus telephonicus]|uniref:DUF4181 domain-containing protein n=1 Tax=Lysinibacillus telephonicus TaxID=1714840 RepID=UPI0031FC4CDA